MKELLNLNRLKERLLNDLPGEEAQLRMSPTFRGSFIHAAEPVKAAVLVLMYPRNGQICIVFMKRNEYDGPHSAQVSFPGGAWEPADGSLEITAIRETREELGIKGKIEVLGTLTELFIPVSNFLVTPFLGWMDRAPEFFPDQSEVQYIIEAPLKDLADPANRDSERLYRHGQSIEAPFYRVGKEKIWGATAMMLSEYLQLASMLQ
ncbi:MAG: CoA pyrophosphatase [Bacteroidota bacterium]